MNEHVDASAPETIEHVMSQMGEALNTIMRRVSVDVRECSGVISPAQFYLLKMLSNFGAQRMSELAERLDITQSGCTAIVDRTIAAGLVARARDPSDRRVVWVKVTDEGENALRELQRVHTALVARYIREMNVEDVEQLAGLFQQMAEVLLAIKQQDETCESAH